MNFQYIEIIIKIFLYLMEILKMSTVYEYREGGDNGLFIESPQSFLVMFYYSLATQLWGLLLNFNWLVQ